MAARLQVQGEIRRLRPRDADAHQTRPLALGLRQDRIAVIGLTGVAEFIDGNMDRPYNAPLSLCGIMYDLMGV